MKKPTSPQFTAAFAVAAALSITLLLPARAGVGTTPVITITNGTNTDTSGASWNTWGGLTYTSSTYPYLVTHYDWSSDNSAQQWFYGLSDYKDATVYHRRVIVYDGSTIVWQSCPPDLMDSYTIPGTGYWYQGGAVKPDPTDFFGSSANDVVYKIQSGGTPTGLSATQFTLSKNES